MRTKEVYKKRRGFMKKGKVNLYLDREVYEKADQLLNEKGFSVSRYVNLVLKEYIQVTEGQPMNKRLEDMNLSEFLDLAKYWITEMQEDKQENIDDVQLINEQPE
jgi:antitoxin component of RelBE/YafQ-DinJ toxin-antitoxin module